MWRVHSSAGSTQLATLYDDGTTHVDVEPLDVIARLAALLPKPRGTPDRIRGRLWHVSKAYSRPTSNTPDIGVVGEYERPPPSHYDVLPDSLGLDGGGLTADPYPSEPLGHSIRSGGSGSNRSKPDEAATLQRRSKDNCLMQRTKKCVAATSLPLCRLTCKHPDAMDEHVSFVAVRCRLRGPMGHIRYVR